MHYNNNNPHATSKRLTLKGARVTKHTYRLSQAHVVNGNLLSLDPIWVIIGTLLPKGTCPLLDANSAICD